MPPRQGWGGFEVRKTLSEILALAWEKQAEYLEGLSCQDLEVLMFALLRDKEQERCTDVFDRFFTAAYSVLRDCREGRR